MKFYLYMVLSGFGLLKDRVQIYNPNPISEVHMGIGFNGFRLGSLGIGSNRNIESD